MSKPKISIIIRTFNEEKHIGKLLKAIAGQDFQDYEIIMVDSGSTDKTLEIAKDFPVSVISIEKRDFTFGYSLNCGCKKAGGRYLVFVSAHAIPAGSKWLSSLIAPFEDEKVAMVYGRQVGSRESKFSEKRDLQKFFKDAPLDAALILGCANNANAAVRKDLWQKRPFDEYLFGLEDIDWARYATGEGFSVYYEPKAAVYHIHEEKWPQIFNRYRREAIAAARIGLSGPVQARTGFFWLANNFFQDILTSFPNVSLSRLEEIGKFRYFQWKGSRQGWIHDKHVDLDREKYSLFYPSANQAVVIGAKNQARFTENPLPELKPGDILIQVEYVGVCRTDMEVHEGSLGYYRDGLAQYPIIPGHEFSGTIVGIGASTKYRERFKVGERVIGECVLSDGAKSERQEVGVINYNGAYSQFIVMPGEYVHKIPDSVDLKTASLAEPLAVVLRAIKRIKTGLGQAEKIAVAGAGPIGNLCSQVLAHRGYKVTVFDKSRERLDLLKDSAETGQEIKNLVDYGVVIEATGSVQVLEQLLRESRTNATILLLGFPYGKIEYNFEDVVGREKAIVGSVGGREEDFEEALLLLPELHLQPFLQKVFPLKDFKKAWQAQKDPKNIKVLLKP